MVKSPWLHRVSCMHHASERLNGEPRRRSAVLNAYDSVPTHIPFPHYIVPSRTNDSMAFARFAICNSFTLSLRYFDYFRKTWTRLACVGKGQIRVRSCDFVTCMDSLPYGTTEAAPGFGLQGRFLPSASTSPLRRPMPNTVEPLPRLSQLTAKHLCILIIILFGRSWG